MSKGRRGRSVYDALDDGTAGLWAVKDRGDLAVVRDLEEAAFPSMPQTALQHVAVDQVLPIAEIGAALTQLVGQEVPAAEENKPMASNVMKTETQIAQEANALALGVMTLGPLTAYTCPECSGVLVELKDGGILRFRCHTGHEYSVHSLLAAVTETVEGALHGAMRGVEESALIIQQLAQQLRENHDELAAQVYEQKSNEAVQRADPIHQAIRRHEARS